MENVIFVKSCTCLFFGFFLTVIMFFQIYRYVSIFIQSSIFSRTSSLSTDRFCTYSCFSPNTEKQEFPTLGILGLFIPVALLDTNIGISEELCLNLSVLTQIMSTRIVTQRNQQQSQEIASEDQLPPRHANHTKIKGEIDFS